MAKSKTKAAKRGAPTGNVSTEGNLPSPNENPNRTHRDIQTVQALFTFHFPDTYISGWRPIRGGADMPIDSPCGSECEKAILAGAALQAHARAAYGGDPLIGTVVVQVCEVYING